MDKRKDILILATRIIIGGLFIFAGWAKASDMGMTVGFFSQMGLPAFLAYIVTYAELAGGVAVILGLWTELAACGLAIIMIGATYYSYKMAPMMNVPAFQAIMPTLAIFAALCALMAVGAGRCKVKLPSRKPAMA
ncbi:MAG TPA: DoxX family protein [Candidatus Paceibacterota bacterium]|nr:DoxX family protein [Candidatus Paceibacterota bacterium]